MDDTQYLDSQIIQDFLDTKKFEGKTDSTLKQYKYRINQLSEYLKKETNSLIDATAQDLRKYLMLYKKNKNVQNITLENMRKIFNSFYDWAYKNGYTDKNPTETLTKIKFPKVIKEGFTEEELDSLREACRNKRDRALVEFLFSTGIRVSELVSIKQTDLDYNNRCLTVTGKGNKQRKVFFSVIAKKRLQEYLQDRKDNNPSLFVGLNAPHNTLQVRSVQDSLKKIGDSCGVHCHPHKFRHTCATTLLNKGMPIEEVSKLLGHEDISTTMLYCTVDDNLVSMNHKRIL